MAVRRARSWLAALLVVVVLVAGLMVVDAHVRDQAEQRTSAQVAEQLGGARVTTELGGWPILLAGVTKRVERVHVTADDAVVTIEGRTGTVESIDITAEGLSPWDDLPQATAEDLDADIAFRWSDLEAMTGFPLSYVSGNRVSASLTVEYFGATIAIQVEGDLDLAADGSLTIADPTAEVAGIDVPESIVTGALDALAAEMRLPQPAGLVYEGLDIDADGVVAHLHGTGVAVGELI